jgi:hypothetical protein
MSFKGVIIIVVLLRGFFNELIFYSDKTIKKHKIGFWLIFRRSPP